MLYDNTGRSTSFFCLESVLLTCLFWFPTIHSNLYLSEVCKIPGVISMVTRELNVKCYAALNYFFKRNFKKPAKIQCWGKLPDWQAWEIIISLLAKKRQLQWQHFPWDHKLTTQAPDVPRNVVLQPSWPLAGEMGPLATEALCRTPNWPHDSK